MTVTSEVVPCSVDGCEAPKQRKGYCGRHYARQYRWGTTGLAGPQPKPCVKCGVVFQPRYNAHVYCSDRCRLGEATCLACGTAFVIKDGSAGKYCCSECWYSVDRSRPCPWCGQPFQGAGKTCSRECGYAMRRANHPTRVVECEYCNNDIIDKKPSIRFCSHSCAMRAREQSRGATLPDGSRRPTGAGYWQIKVDGKWILEHRHIVAQELGRELLPHERVHHKNGRRDDNDPSNLELWRIKGKDPAGVRASDYHCPGCRCEG